MNWLLLRGLGREQRHWEQFPSLLASTLGVQVYCLDLPGAGTENRRLSPLSIRKIVEDVRSRWLLIQKQTPNTSWNAFGVSMGGMVLQKWAALYPQDFGRIVLLNSSAANIAAFYERLRPRLVPDIVRMTFSNDPLFIEKKILNFTTHLDLNKPENAAIAERWADFSRKSPMLIPNFFRQLIAGATFMAPKKLQPPVLVLTSKGDSFTSPHCSIRLARRYRAALCIHPSGGHDLTLDDSAWVIQRIQEWAT